MTIITRHGEKRSRKRLGLKKKAIERDVEAALEQGATHADTRGRLRKFLDKLYLSHENATNMRIHRGRVYLFNEDTLITVITLPGNLQKTADNIKKKKSEG